MKNVNIKVLAEAFELVKAGRYDMAIYLLSTEGITEKKYPKSYKRFFWNANRSKDNGWSTEKFLEILLNKKHGFSEEAYSSFVNEAGDKIPCGTTVRFLHEAFSSENSEYIIANLEWLKEGRSQGVGAWENIEFRAYHRLKKLGLKIPEELREEVNEFYRELHAGEYHTPSKVIRNRFEQAAFEFEAMPALPLDEVDIRDEYVDLRGGYRQGKQIAGRILLEETAAMRGLLSYITTPDRNVVFMWNRFKAAATRVLNMCPELLSEEEYYSLKEIFNLIKKGKEEWLQRGFESTMIWGFPPVSKNEEVDEEDLLF